MNKDKRLIVECDGYQLRVEQRGSGPNLLIIGSVSYYKKVIPDLLQAYFTCVYIDHRGFAKCLKARPDDTVSLSTISDDIEVVCNRLQISKTSVLGHSGHAYMAMHFAGHSKVEVDQVIAVGAAPNLSASMQERQLAHWSAYASKQRQNLLDESMAKLDSDIAKQPERKFVHICRRLGPMRWTNPCFDEIHLWEGVETNTLLLDKLWGEIFSEIDVTQMTSTLELTVMNGDLDFSIAPLEEWTNIESAFRSLKLIELKGVSHTPMLENPQQFVDMMLSIRKLKN